MADHDIRSLLVKPDSRIRDAVECIDRSGRIALALVVDASGHLRNTVSDGDVRRALLAGHDLGAPVSRLLEIKARTPHPVPVTAPAGTSSALLLELMTQFKVRQIPLIDGEGRAVDIVIQQDLLPSEPPGISAVIMAGGRGVRLRPLTDDTPKPMLPLEGRPVLEHIIENVRKVGVREIYIATHYLSEKITDYFGDGGAHDVRIHYLREQQPLGTAGALSLLGEVQDRLLVMNGDIVTDVDFRAMLAFHMESASQMTVAVRHYTVSVPYGVMQFDGDGITAIDEKPDFTFFVNAGIYLLEPRTRAFVPRGVRFDMTDLVKRMIDGHHRVVGFPLREYWLDIGMPSDYAKAQEDARTKGSE